jgi:hypothetical protein
MNKFILLIGLLVFSLGIAGAQQTRSLEKEAKADSPTTVQENSPRVTTIPVGDLYKNGNQGDYLKYVQTISDYAAEYEYYIQEINVMDIAYLRGENADGHKNTFRIEETSLPDDTKVTSVITQLKTMEVVHRFSNKPFNEPHIKKVAEPAKPVTRTLKARDTDPATTAQKEAWNAYLDNIYKGAITKLQAEQKIMGRKKSSLLDNINRDIALLESHKKDHSLFYSK